MSKKNLIVTISCFIFITCGNPTNIRQKENKQEMNIQNLQSENILDRINKVPISRLPLGIENLDSIDKIDFSNFGIYNVPIDYKADINNRYLLNDFFRKSLDLAGYDWNLLELGLRVSPVDSVEIYFSKRLPPKGNRNYFLCKIVQHLNSRAEPFTGWILLNMSGVSVNEWIQVAQCGEWEDTIRKYALFYMDEDYNITINAYVSNSRYNSTTIGVLYAKQHYYLSNEDNSIYPGEVEEIEPENIED